MGQVRIWKPMITELSDNRWHVAWEEKYPCPLCDYVADSPIELVDHAEDEHELPIYRGEKQSAWSLKYNVKKV